MNLQLILGSGIKSETPLVAAWQGYINPDMMQNELAAIQKRRGKSEQVLEHDFWSLNETNLWQKKMGNEAG
jgi:hypothetical protein